MIIVLLSPVDHSNAGLLEVIRHGKLRVSVERDVLSLSPARWYRNISIWVPCVVISEGFGCCATPVVIGLRLRYLVCVLRRRILLLTVDHLLKEELMDLDVAVVHDKVF